MLGLTLMLGYLGADGFTSTFQDKLFRGYQMSAFNQMLYINAFSSVISAVGARCTCMRPLKRRPCAMLFMFENVSAMSLFADARWPSWRVSFSSSCACYRFW